MKFTFLNISNQKIIISVDGGEHITLLPNENTSIEAQSKSAHKVSIKSATPSHYQRGLYYLNIITDYQVFESDESVQFKISCDNYSTYSCINLIRAKMCIQEYECIFNAFTVENKAEIEKTFKKNERKALFFPDFFENIDIYALLILIGIAIFYFSGWKAGLIYSVVAYILLVLGTHLLNKIWSAVFKRAFRATDDKTDFKKFTDDNYLMQWFSDPQNTSDSKTREKKRKRRKRSVFSK